MSKLTAVSLFAGVGGFDLAMERNGIDVVAAVEIDKHARSVLSKQFPNTTIFNDVTEVTGEQLRAAGFIPERGIITGGFPCQDLSVAGKRAGLAGKRSGLFWEIVRLVDELAPAYFVLENVPGLLSSNGGRDMGTVIGALSGRGYGVSWRVLDAQHFGVPQRRRRVFIVGCAGDNGAASSEILALSEGLRGNPPKGRTPRQETARDAREGSPVGSLTSSGFRCDLNKAAAGHLQPMPPTTPEGTWWDGSDTAATLTVNSDKQRMPDKGNFQAVVETTGNTVFGQTGFSKFTEGEVTTLQATSHKRADENVVVRDF